MLVNQMQSANELSSQSNEALLFCRSIQTQQGRLKMIQAAVCTDSYVFLDEQVLPQTILCT